MCENGKIKITQCPLNLITPDVGQAIMHAELFEKGMPVVAGGQLDQTQWFLCVYYFVMNEKAFWKKKFGIF